MKTLDPIHCGPLRLSWRNCGDRVGHSLAIDRDSDTLSPLLESIEGASHYLTQNNAKQTPLLLSEAWPASPPLTNWHCEPRPAGSVAFGVGVAGKTHFSAAVEFQSTAHGCGITFDIAARVTTLPAFVGSHYRCAASCRIFDATQVELARGVQLRFDPAAVRLRLDEASRLLVIEPLSVTAKSFPQTLRWQYEIAIDGLIASPDRH